VLERTGLLTHPVAITLVILPQSVRSKRSDFGHDGITTRKGRKGKFSHVYAGKSVASLGWPQGMRGGVIGPTVQEHVSLTRNALV
jgi:hypothetical protein